MRIHILIITLLMATLVKAQPNFALVGYATQNGGTTGGQGGTTVTAKTYAELKSYAESTTKYIINVEGTISNGTTGGQIKIKSNKSIIGVGSTAFLSGIGLDVASQNNVIIQNLKITLVGTLNSAGINGGDCISIYGTSKNIWIDHCEIYSENPDTQTDKDKYDGLLDIKQQTGFITISWCYFHDHHKGSLVGAADDDLGDERLVTIHHNYYNKVLLRVPMYRGATGHFFNNYIKDSDKASEIRANTCVRIEKNYYDNFSEFAIYTTSDSPGKTERIDNYLSKTQSRAYPANCTASIPYTYSNVLTTNTTDIKTIVPQYAGVGKIGVIKDCNGIVNGTAYLDNCARCVGGNTNKTACTKDCKGVWGGTTLTDNCGTCLTNTSIKSCTGSMEAELACSVDGIQQEDKNVGFKGDGYVNADNSIGAGASWVLSSSSSQTATISFRYANGGTTSRDGEIIVNGKVVGILLLPPTGDWTTWKIASVNLAMQSGYNNLSLKATSADGLANLDQLIFSSGVTDANCVVIGVEHLSVSDLRVYPNPTAGLVFLTEEMDWELFNIYGEKLSVGQGIVIDMNDSPTGIYFIRIESELVKVVKE